MVYRKHCIFHPHEGSQWGLRMGLEGFGGFSWFQLGKDMGGQAGWRNYQSFSDDKDGVDGGADW